MINFKSFCFMNKFTQYCTHEQSVIFTVKNGSDWQAYSDPHYTVCYRKQGGEGHAPIFFKSYVIERIMQYIYIY